MATKIKPLRKFSTGAPSTSDMEAGEIAVNTADQKIYMRDDSNNIVEVANSSGSAADDITTGDAAVTIATSSGNITIDAQGSDTDIIFKGTNNTTDITALTLDMSAEGNAIFNHDVKVGATGAYKFTDTHSSDSAQIFVDATETSGQQTNMILQVGDDATTSNQDQIRIRHRHYSTSPQDLDIAIFKRDTSNGAIGNTAFNGIVSVSGAFSATTKSFDIKHPTKDDMRLRYGVLEGPEHGVYIRGKLVNSNVIELPDHWTGLVDEDTITVQLTSIGKFQKLYVKEINDNKITIGNSSFFSNKTECFYFVKGTRKDVDELEIEYEN